MVRVRVAFEHLGESFRAGDEVPDDHPLIRVGPHLFDLPAPVPVPDPVVPVRIRGLLVNPPKKGK